MSEAAKAYENCDRTFKPVFAEPRPQNKDNYGGGGGSDFGGRGPGSGGGAGNNINSGGGGGAMDMRNDMYRPTNDTFGAGGCGSLSEQEWVYPKFGC